jgi:hypothetical protein
MGQNFGSILQWELNRENPQKVTYMGWEKGKYYSRSRRVDGRVVREYVGCGQIAEIAARVDAIEREERTTQRELESLQREESRKFDRTFSDLCRIVNLVQEAALLCQGIHCHRGEWRKRRVSKSNP